MSERPQVDPPPQVRGPSAGGRVCRAAAEFWLRAMFLACERFPGLVRSVRRPICRGTFAASKQIRRSTLANAARILGPASTAAERAAVGRGVLASFYTFCLDVGRSANMTPEQLRAEIGTVHGHDRYRAAVAAGRGVIVVTAHMGSFEVGLAALAAQGQPLNVIFKRDARGGFERQRTALRERLGVREHPVDDGWTMWIGLRDALAAGEAVIFQGDRVMPGQRGRRVPFLHGHLVLPTGPAKLARISGAPILPIFSIRNDSGKIDLFVEPPIEFDPAAEGAAPAGDDPLTARVAEVLERFVRTYPDQWLMFEPAFCEDQSAPTVAAAIGRPLRVEPGTGGPAPKLKDVTFG